MFKYNEFRSGRIDPFAIALVVMLGLVVTACAPAAVVPASPTLAPATATVPPTAVAAATLVPTALPSATTQPTVPPTATEKPTLPPTATEAPTLAPTATEEPTLPPTPTVEPTVELPTATAEAAPSVSSDTSTTAGPTLSIPMRATATAEAKIAETNKCLGCHGPFEKLVAASKDWKSPNGEAVNPHTTVDDSILKVHTSGKGMLNCTTCHVAHPQPLTSVADIKPADVEYCYTQCHHQNNFTPCSACHESYK